MINLTDIFALIDEGIVDSPPAAPRSNTAASVRQFLKAFVEWLAAQDYAPDHEWNGTQLRFINPDGTPGPYVDLRGLQGLQGLKGDPGTLTNSAIPARTTAINRAQEKMLVQRADHVLEKVTLYQLAGGQPLTTGNLVTNGNGEFGDLSNIKAGNAANLSFDAAQVSTAGGKGAFKWNGGAEALTILDLIPVNLMRRHRISVVARTGNTNGTNYDAAARTYFGLVCLDADGNTISPNHFAKVSGAALTTLAAPLNPGATSVTLTSAAGWHNGSNAQYRGLAWYPYVNALGQVYPDYGYSRNVVANAWGTGGIAGNVITLSTPWAGPALAAGTKVANVMDGGTYLYSSVLNNAHVPNAWTSYEFYVQGVNAGSTEDAGNLQFRPGTAFIRPILLANYNSPAAGTTFYFSMLDVRESGFDLATLLAGNNAFSGANTFSGANAFTGDVTLKRIISGSGSAPTAATGSGLGAGGSVTIGAGSTDMAGTITINMGTSPPTNQTIATITFAAALAAAPKAILLTARNNQGGMGIGRFYIDVKTASTFTIRSTDSAPSASTQYIYDYLVIA